MAENNYNYDNPTLSSPGSVENLVREGKIADPEGKHQPKTPGKKREPIPSTLKLEDLPKDQEINNFDKRKVIVYEERTDVGREFITYEGYWYVEFLRGYEEQAKAWLKAKLAAGEGHVTKYERKGRTLFEYVLADSRKELDKRNLTLDQLRKDYDDAEDITAYFKDIPRDVSVDNVEYFLLNDLSQYEADAQLKADLKYFTSDGSNLADTYIGGSLSNGDIGFYYDRGGRLRATYDPVFLYRAKALIEDLITYGSPDQYVMGYFRHGVVQFVIEKDLVEKLIQVYGTEDTLVLRWNNVDTDAPHFKMGDYPGFEDVLDIHSKQYLSSDAIFEFTKEKEKKPTANA